MFVAWMEANRKYPKGRSLMFGQYPKYFVYDFESQEWHPRKKRIFY